MPIQFRCNHCNKPVQAPDTAAGKNAKCPTCGKTITVPKMDSGDDPLAGIDEFLAGQPSPISNTGPKQNPNPQPQPRRGTVATPRPIVTQPQGAPTVTNSGIISCPFCGEDIRTTARKCKHCGEWLDKISGREGTGYVERGSADARSVTRGLKEKEFHDHMLGCGGFLILLVAIAAGAATHWIVGLILFFVLLFPLSKWYWKE